ncbi:MAG TPA: rRNA maturation RNase YbeY [Terriglobales bacterium]|nr:rRNA maturation RNase YbeY [Terriglobales bacterium]
MVILRHPIAGVSRTALERFAGRARRAAGLRGEVNVLVTGDAELRRLNRQFRHQDKPTDVLSFPGPDPDFAGDIAISAATASRNARRLGHSTVDELKLLLLHGVLHLAGYDHERDQGEMARKEQRLRRNLGLPTSLTERANGSGRRPRS